MSSSRRLLERNMSRAEPRAKRSLAAGGCRSAAAAATTACAATWASMRTSSRACRRKKQHRAAVYITPLEAAITSVPLRQKVEIGVVEPRSQEKAKPVAATVALRKLDIGVFLGACRRSSGLVLDSREVCC